MASSAKTLAIQIAAQLKANKALEPSLSWLEACLGTARPATPMTAMYQTALFRILASDITMSLQPVPSACFPADILNADIKERHLEGPIVLQVIDIEDMSKSRWEQVEAIEALERGEGTKGREIIRVVATEDGDNPNTAANKGGGPHKLLVQDTRGVRLYGIELKTVNGISLGMSLGSKMVLKNVAVSRGVIMLEPTTTTLLGGKIESLHKDWKANRKAHLKAAIETQEHPAS
ncbi:hypothetical protein MMC19_001290 [Ptychographa xylographoides]|nr:hypothetical protein [Ptychographa xylographoides]